MTKIDTQPEALRLADWLDANSSGVYRPAAEAAAELRRLTAELARVTNNRDMWEDQCAAQAQQIAQDRADAARYQWLLHAPVSKQDIWLAYLPEQANDYADRQIALAAMKEKTP